MAAPEINISVSPPPRIIQLFAPATPFVKQRKLPAEGSPQMYHNVVEAGLLAVQNETVQGPDKLVVHPVLI